MANPFSSDPLFPEVASDVAAASQGQWFTDATLAELNRETAVFNTSVRYTHHDLPKLRLRYALTHFWYLSPIFRHDCDKHFRHTWYVEDVKDMITDGQIHWQSCFWKVIYLQTGLLHLPSDVKLHLSFRRERGCNFGYVVISSVVYTLNNPQPITWPKIWCSRIFDPIIESEDYYADQIGTTTEPEEY